MSDERNICMQFLLAGLVGAFVVLGGLFLPKWGTVQVNPVQSITVVGEAKSQSKMQVAQFTAGVNTTNDDKQAAIDDVNKKMTAIVEAVKQFGVSSDDIQTQNMSIYQNQDTYYEDGRQKMRPGQWNVSNYITITLRTIDRADTLASILSKSGATNVNGPQFQFDDTSDIGVGLLSDALKNALEKAEKIAAASKRKVGAVISVSEGVNTEPVYFKGGLGGGGGAGPIESGSGTVTKSVTVTYELR